MVALTVISLLLLSRTQSLLTGGWEALIDRTDAKAPPAVGWSPRAVPSNEFLDGVGHAESLWYRKTIRILPKADEAVLIRFPSALYCPELFVDGTLVDRWTNGWTAHETDITPFVRDGGPHTVALRCHDRTVTNDGGFIPPAGSGDDALRGKVVMPIGGYHAMIGILEPPTLNIKPKVRILDQTLSIVPSVRLKQLSLSVMTNAGSAVHADVIDANGGRVAEGELNRDEKGTWTTTLPWSAAKLWSPERPYLYTLRLTLKQGDNTLDTVEKPFGFREFWTKGPDFYLNGVKRHLLATSTWPQTRYIDDATMRARLRTVKKSGAIAFRPHIGPWGENLLDIADQEGVLIVLEAPVYTDGSGFYAYQNPKFWANYSEVVAGLIQRGRNHPSVVMLSLGNEILFMGNQKYAQDLPKRQGELAEFARSLDPTRPMTFEADLDPDGKFDVIGLHYPHELPAQHAYPAICDWLGSGKQTEAAGGMLGAKSSSFKWDRKKPLYIGEYLWSPFGDYSAGTVFYGDEAYNDRERYTNKAKGDAWYDQTIAYRRSGVSGLSPWSPFGFGLATMDPELYPAQTRAYQPVMAALRNRAFRTFAGQPLKLDFDLFNDSPDIQKMKVSVAGAGSISRIVEPGENELVSIPVVSSTSKPITITLTANEKVVNRQTVQLEVSPNGPLTTPKGFKVVNVNSAQSMAQLKSSDAATTIALVAAHLLEGAAPRKDGLPVVGSTGIDSAPLLGFLNRGGRAVILEQSGYGNLPLPVELVDDPATMAFGWPEMKFWGRDNYVCDRQIARTGMHGVRSLVTTGGPNSLAQGPIALVPVGAGNAVLIQALAGKKLAEDPAAKHTIERALSLVAATPPNASGKVLALVESDLDRTLVNSVGLDVLLNESLSPQVARTAKGIVILGEPKGLNESLPALKAAREAGVPVVWLSAGASAFELSKSALGFDSLSARATATVPTAHDLSSALARGLTAEEFVWTSTPQGWDRTMTYREGVCRAMLLPNTPSSPLLTVSGTKLASGAAYVEDGASVFARKGESEVTVSVPSEGWYKLSIEASSRNGALVGLKVNGIARDRWKPLAAAFETVVALRKGQNRITIQHLNGREWGTGPMLAVRQIQISKPIDYPAGVEVLAGPGALVAKGNVVVGTCGLEDRENLTKSRRILTSLCANLSMPFVAPAASSECSLPISRFKVESGPYNEVQSSTLVLRSNGSAVTDLFCAKETTIAARLAVASTSCAGVYGHLVIEVDGVKVGEVQANQAAEATYATKQFAVSKGRHSLRIRFDNDTNNGVEDINVEVHRVALVAAH